MTGMHNMKTRSVPKAKPQVNEIELIRDGETRAHIRSLSLWT